MAEQNITKFKAPDVQLAQSAGWSLQSHNLGVSGAAHAAKMEGQLISNALETGGKLADSFTQLAETVVDEHSSAVAYNASDEFQEQFEGYLLHTPPTTQKDFEDAFRSAATNAMSKLSGGANKKFIAFLSVYGDKKLKQFQETTAKDQLAFTKITTEQGLKESLHEEAMQMVGQRKDVQQAGMELALEEIHEVMPSALFNVNDKIARFKEVQKKYNTAAFLSGNGQIDGELGLDKQMLDAYIGSVEKRDKLIQRGLTMQQMQAVETIAASGYKQKVLDDNAAHLDDLTRYELQRRVMAATGGKTQKDAKAIVAGFVKHTTPFIDLQEESQRTGIPLDMYIADKKKKGREATQFHKATLHSMRTELGIPASDAQEGVVPGTAIQQMRNLYGKQWKEYLGSIEDQMVTAIDDFLIQSPDSYQVNIDKFKSQVYPMLITNIRMAMKAKQEQVQGMRKSIQNETKSKNWFQRLVEKIT